MKISSQFIFTILVILAFAACKSERTQPVAPQQKAAPAEKDSMLYGLVCEGTNGNALVFYEFKDNAQPRTFNIEVAYREGRVVGRMRTGDWVGVMVNPEDSTEATMAIDLDQIKGTWTHTVYPVWKDASKMSKRALRRKLAELPDSLKALYMIPKEYGFSLKRSSQAVPVGIDINQASTEDSPVEYPAMRCVIRWKCRNGKLLLTTVDNDQLGEAMQMVEKNMDTKKAGARTDTLDVMMMTEDSLVMRTVAGETMSFHRTQK